MHEELETMISQPNEITIGGKTLSLNPVTMAQLQPAIRAALPILQALKTGELELESLKKMDPLTWAIAYANYGESINETVAFMAGIPPQELAGMPPHDVFFLASKVVTVNTDFFVFLVLLINGAPGKANPDQPETQTAETGPNPSSD